MKKKLKGRTFYRPMGVFIYFFNPRGDGFPKNEFCDRTTKGGEMCHVGHSGLVAPSEIYTLTPEYGS